MRTQLPRPYHASENIHEECEIDEALLELDVGNISHPDLIGSTDFKLLNSVDPRGLSFKGSRGLTDAFHRYREIRCFHQPGDASIPNGVSLIHQQLCDTPIPIRWIL